MKGHLRTCPPRARRVCALRHRPCRQAGASLVEFAIILPIFALMLFGMIQFGLGFAGWTASGTPFRPVPAGRQQRGKPIRRQLRPKRPRAEHGVPDRPSYWGTS